MEFYSARHIYKLGEALKVSGTMLHAHVKFQIIQYASIYEAVIAYLLWGMFSNSDAVSKIEYHEAYKKAESWPSSLNVANKDGEEIFLCTRRKERTSQVSIKFESKIKAAVEIGFLQPDLAEDIQEFFRLRNAIHLNTAVEREISYEIQQSELAYRRMRPFIDGVKEFLGTNPQQTVPETGLE